MSACGEVDPNDHEDRLEGIRRRFVARSVDRVDELLVAARAVPTFDERRAEEATSVVHRLAGAAGTFGMPTLAGMAGSLEDAMTVARPSDVSPLLLRDLPAIRNHLSGGDDHAG